MASLCTGTATAALQPILRTSFCSDSGGLVKAYVFSFADVDWTATALPANFNPTTETVLNLPFLTGKQAYEVQTDAGPSTVTGTLASGTFENTATLFFEGQSCDRDLKLNLLRNRCDLCVLFVGDCFKRIAGVKWNGTGFEQTKKSVKLTGWEYTFGTDGGDIPSDTATLTWKSTSKMLCADGMTTIDTTP